MICPKDLAAVISAISIEFTEGKSIEEMNIWSAIFTQIGAIIDTIAIQQSNFEMCIDNANKNNNQTKSSD